MKLSPTQKRKNQKGFTLVELAIVLVIIGLIVGGVLAGQDLIKAATIRATQAQLASVNTGATAFLNKFNGLPGDLVAATAASANFTPLSTLGSQGLRDGNGLVEGVGATATAPTVGGEVDAFWSDLSTANLYAGAPSTYSSVAANAAIAANSPAITATNAPTYFPATKLRTSAQIMVTNYLGKNTLFIGGITAPVGSGTASGTPALSNSVTPLEASNMDSKLDDGNPITGVFIVPVTALTGPTAVPASVSSSTCLTASTTGAYNIASTGSTAGGARLNCIVGFSSSF